MISVYFDSQIFRYLKNIDMLPEDQRPLFTKLESYIHNYKEHFQFFYSHAHILDLSNDKSEKKYEDLDFMKSIVQDNFLIRFHEKEHSEYLLVEPKDAFGKYKPDDVINLSSIDFNDVFDLEKYKEDIEETKYLEMKQQLDLLKEIKLSDLMPSLDQMPKDAKETFPFFNLDSDTSFVDLLNSFGEFAQKFTDDNSVYKSMRDYISHNPHGIKFSIDLSTFDFTTEYKDSTTQKNFLEVIKGSLNTDNLSQFDQHYQGYFHLDIYGIEAEKRGKLKTANLLHDAHHSYYGAYCDIFVSDDIQVRAKSKVIYKLLGLETKVLSVDEFVNEMFWISLEIDYNESQLWTKIVSILKTSFVKRLLRPSPERTVLIYDSKHFFLSYFNEVRYVSEYEWNYIVFRHQIQNYHSSMPDFKVILSVTNKAIDLFGIDDFGLGYFCYEREIAEVDEEKWDGRVWHRDNVEIALQVNPEVRKLNLVIRTKS